MNLGPKYKYSLISFVLSVITLMGVYALVGIIPFGDRTMIVWDMESQFSGFLSWYSYVLHGKADFWYSLRGALGSSQIGLYSYYLASPLNLILIFFNEKTLPVAVIVLLSIKVGLSGATMNWYLQTIRESEGSDTTITDWVSIALAMLYAVSSFVVSFQYNTMWMDAYLLLPMVVLGLDLLISEGRGVLYAVTLGLCVLANYYTGFMVCLFSVIYFIAMIIHRRVGRGRIIVNYLIYSVAGGFLSMFITLPGVLTLMDSSSGRVLGIKDFLDFSLIINPLEEIKYFFAGMFDAGQGIHGSYPMLYAGAMVVFASCFFLICRRIGWREKTSYLLILALLMIGMICRGPYIIWHGFILPSGCFERFAFLWVFLAIVMAWRAVPEINRENIVDLVITAVIVVMLLAIVFMRGGSLLKIGLNLILIVLSVLLILVINGIQETKHTLLKVIVTVMLILITMAELIYNGRVIHKNQFTDDLYVSYEAYENNYESFRNLYEQADISDSERMVVLNGLGRSWNHGYLRNINSINMYASSEKEKTWEIYGNLCLGAPDWESEAEYDTYATALAADILGVKYVLEQPYSMIYTVGDLETLYDIPGMTRIASAGAEDMHMNNACLPLAYLVTEDALKIGGGEDEVIKIGADEVSDASDGDSDLFERLNNLYHVLYGAEDEDIYTVIDTDTDGFAELPEWYNTKENRVILEPDGTYSDGSRIASEDVELLDKTVTALAQYTSEVNVNNSHITATISNPTDDVLYACIAVAFDDAWDVKVVNEQNSRGAKVEAKPGMGGLMLVPVEPGVNTIQMTYHTRGLGIGILISLIGLAMLISWVWYSNRKVINQKGTINAAN